MNKPVLQKMIKELCGLENRDRVYLPTEMRVGNGWNGSLEGFFADGVVMVYCQGGNTDWSECASLDSVLRDNGADPYATVHYNKHEGRVEIDYSEGWLREQRKKMKK